MATLAFALFARGPARCHAEVGRGAPSLALRVLYPKGLCVSYRGLAAATKPRLAGFAASPRTEEGMSAG